MGLTHSQQLFSITTKVDPHTLAFPNKKKGGSSCEFFVFMGLQATYKWATFSMMPYDWVCMASTFNMAINKLNQEQGLTLSLKTLRALLDKLSEVEVEIFSRIQDNNYWGKSFRMFFFSVSTC